MSLTFCSAAAADAHAPFLNCQGIAGTELLDVLPSSQRMSNEGLNILRVVPLGRSSTEKPGACGTHFVYRQIGASVQDPETEELQ